MRGLHIHSLRHSPDSSTRTHHSSESAPWAKEFRAEVAHFLHLDRRPGAHPGRGSLSREASSASSVWFDAGGVSSIEGKLVAEQEKMGKGGVNTLVPMHRRGAAQSSASFVAGKILLSGLADKLTSQACANARWQPACAGRAQTWARARAPHPLSHTLSLSLSQAFFNPHVMPMLAALFNPSLHNHNSRPRLAAIATDSADSSPPLSAQLHLIAVPAAYDMAIAARKTLLEKVPAGFIPRRSISDPMRGRDRSALQMNKALTRARQALQSNRNNAAAPEPDTEPAVDRGTWQGHTWCTPTPCTVH